MKKTKKYCTRYYHDNTWWASEIMAWDWEDAEVRCKKLNMQLDGEYVMEIPAGPEFIPNMICKVKNLFSRG